MMFTPKKSHSKANWSQSVMLKQMTNGDRSSINRSPTNHNQDGAD